MIFLAKNIVSESRDQIIHCVADEGRHKTKMSEKRHTRKAGRDAQGSVALLVEMVTFKKENGMQHPGIQPEAFHHGYAIAGLKRRESEILLPIATKHELYGTITEIADTIKKNNCA